jgi:hypothetical protein
MTIVYCHASVSLRDTTLLPTARKLSKISKTLKTLNKKKQKHQKKNRLLSRLETLLPNALKLVALVSENEFLPVTGDNFSKVPYLLAFAR